MVPFGASRVRIVPIVFATRDETTEAPLPEVPLCNAGTDSRAACSLAGGCDPLFNLRAPVWNDACKEARWHETHWNCGSVNSVSSPPYCPDADKRLIDTGSDESPAGPTPGNDRETATMSAGRRGQP